MSVCVCVCVCVCEKGQNGFILCLFYFHFKTDALMSEVLRYIACVKYCTMNKRSNVMYVKGVERSSIYTICMSKLLKKVQSALTHVCS